jgi:hypothetical protein
MKFINKIKHEISLLGDFAKLILKVAYYIIIFIILYKMILPFIKYHLPKSLDITSYESISAFVLIGLCILSYLIGEFFIKLFKVSKK